MARSNKFGTFGGVFTPSILTILGVIMYMRLPMIVGNAGLYATIGIIVVAHLISITTGLSVSSIATDKKVEAGGTYYMISRSLGLPIGGTLGLALFVGLSFSVSLYLIGFSESFLGFFGYEISKDNIRLAGTAILLLVTIITFISTSLALKTQYFIMAAIFLSLLSIFFGKHEFAPVQPNLFGTNGAISLMVLFGIFFPAVTGFEAGVSMSGDLKDPKKSIPFGSIAAIFVGLIAYIGLAFFFSYTVSPEKLANDPKILLKIARVPQLVVAGIWGATLSSALGSILGAPRILQATAVDRITPRFFAKGTGKTNEPRNALLLTFLIAEAGILIGELNIIARVVSIFFITTYGFLNLSCAFEAMTSADFRPSFKTPVWVSLLGSVTAMIVMIQLDFVAMLGATIILGSLYLFLKRKELVLQTGDAWSSIWASLVKTGLKKLKQNRLQSRNWRPNIIMFSGNVGDRPGLVDIGKNIAGKFGMVTGFHLVPSKDPVLVRNTQSMQNTSSEEYFMNVHHCRTIYSGMDEVIRVYGYSGMEPNSILMGWSRNTTKKDEFLKMVDRLQKNNFNSLFLSHNVNKQTKNKKIDLWWSGWGSNLSFGLNLVRHITGSAYWKDADLRLLLVCQDSTMIDSLYFSVRKILESYRIEMEVKVINNAIEQLSRNSLIMKESAKTELCIIGIPDVKFEKIEKMYDEVNRLAVYLGNALFINASDNFESFDLLESVVPVKDQKLNKIQEPDLPDLVLSEFQQISNEIEDIDKSGKSDIDTLFNTVFATGFKECLHLIHEADNIGQTLIYNLGKIQSTKEKFQKERALAKVRNDFFFNSKNTLLQYIEEKLGNREEMFRKGLEEYLDNLDSLVENLPKKLNIIHKRADFFGAKTDSRKIRRYKRRKLTAHPFAKNINVRINFQKTSRFYLIKNRLNHFLELLIQFRDYDLTFLAQLRNYLTFVQEIIDTIEKDITSMSASTLNSNDVRKKLNNQILLMENQLQEEMSFTENSLYLKFRKACQQLNNDLEKIRFNRLLKGKQKTKKYYRRLNSEITGFADFWFEDIKNHTNRVYLDLLINDTRYRISRETEDLLLNISQQVNAELINPINNLNRKLENSAKSTRGKKPVQEFHVGFKLDYLQNTENLSTNIHQLIDALPEEMQISDQTTGETLTGKKIKQESRILTIPVQRIVRHCIDSIFLAPLESLLRDFSDNMKKGEYHIKDHLSYLEFEIENLDDNENNEDRWKEIIRESLNAIRNQEENLQSYTNNLNTEIDGLIDKAFEPLSSHLIIESSQKLVHLIREYQGKQTFSKFGALRMKISDFVKSKTVRLLYSQSEGILFAKKISQDNYSATPQEQIAELVDQIVPDQTLQSKIPTYYNNLFSGKSSIGEDFWIERPVEETQFSKALNRYKRSPRGGIIIYGDRSCGKTALSKHLSKKYFHTDQVMHIFPPIQGSAKVEDFDLAVQKAAGLKGMHSKVAESLKADSVLVIHDLELWWERTDKGYSVISRIMDLIGKYSDRFLVIVNINSYAYKFINSLYNIEDKFMLHINCRPFDSEEIKELIMRRHRSSGMSFMYRKRNDEQVSEIKLAAIFNRIFRISSGNPGLALNIWLSMITNYYNDKLVIRMPKVPDYNALEGLDENWMIILAQIILHKRVSIDKLDNILGLHRSEVQQYINSMLMCGIIVERNDDLYIVNAYLNNAICDLLTKNELI